MSEFDLIDEINRVLGAATQHPSLVVATGDDGCVWRPTAGTDAVASIDTLVSGRHFPEAAAGREVGYRAMMVSVSDLAAMAATPEYALVALTLPELDRDWTLECAEGLREAADVCGITVAGGNLSAGPLSLTLSVHGFVEAGAAVVRTGAKPGDGVYVTGPLGGAAAALADQFHDARLRERYFRPRARVDLTEQLAQTATSAIDISDGLLQDAGHLSTASGCALELSSAAIPLFPGASLDHALRGGDDYELCFTATQAPPFTAHHIGTVAQGSGVKLDGQVVAPDGFQHF